MAPKVKKCLKILGLSLAFIFVWLWGISIGLHQGIIIGLQLKLVGG